MTDETFAASAKAFAETFKTDPAGWRLKVSEDSHGQHKWVYLPPGLPETWPQNAVDKYCQGVDPVSELSRIECSFYSNFQSRQRPRPRSRPRATD
jgi:hypothetical protein